METEDSVRGFLMLSSCHEGSGRSHASPSNKNVAQVYYVSTHGSPLETQVIKVFTGGWSHRQPLPNKYQNSTFPGGKQAFGICTNSLGTMNYPDQLHVDWEQSTSQVLRCQPRAILGSRPFKDGSLRMGLLTLFCTTFFFY